MEIIFVILKAARRHMLSSIFLPAAMFIRVAKGGRVSGAIIPPLMEQVVVRARREASTRTKDTFWTKKLLDAEDHYSKK